MFSTGLYDVRRDDGSTIGLYDDYRLARMRREFDPEAVGIVWIPRSAMMDRTATMRIFSAER